MLEAGRRVGKNQEKRKKRKETRMKSKDEGGGMEVG